MCTLHFLRPRFRSSYPFSAIPNYMCNIAEACQRFFHPASIDEVLDEIIPQINATSLDTLLSTQYYLLTFLPLSHPQVYLPALFRLWEPVNSAMYTSRMIAFLAKLAELHVDPSVSDPARIQSISDDARRTGDSKVQWDRSDMQISVPWTGIWKDVGIFTDDQWSKLMCYTLSSMGKHDPTDVCSFH
jgi:proteasome activator subunit 4